MWQTKTLDDICDIARGGSPRPIKSYLTDDPDGINWIKISDATASNKYIFETKQKIKPEGIQKSRLVNDGDFLLSNSMSFGRPYIMRTSGCIHDGWLVLSDKSGLFDQNYLYYFLSSPAAFQQFDSRAAGSTVRNLNIDLVKSVEIILPPLLEQKRIVDILDEAFAGIDEAIANTEKNLANAREIFDSYLNDVFTKKGEGWGAKRIGELAETQSGGTPLRSKPEYWDGDIAWYSSGELNNAKTVRPQRMVTQLGIDNSNSKIFPKGSLLIGMYDTAALKMSLLDRDAAFNQAIAGMKPTKGVNLKFVLYAINSLKPEILSLRRGVRQKNLSLRKIKDIQIPIPNISKQNSVVDVLDSQYAETRKLYSIYQNKLYSLNELKQSLLAKAFSGELTPSSEHVLKEVVG